jgi:FKBP12-rapamycin complex-associated protein
LYGKNMDEKIGGVMAIKELIECTSAAAENKVAKFAATLANVLKSNTDFELIELVVDTFGHMIRKSPVSQVDFANSEFHRALEWLRGEQPHRRFAACAILTQLAENAPTVFFSRTKEFFDLIWGPLWDTKERIRLSAAQALSACLAVLGQRTYHLEWYCRIYSNIHEGLKRGMRVTK